MQYILISELNDAYANLARDEYLLSSLHEGDMVLYLYVNKSAVIIGRNQNPWIECNLNQLNADGVQLVRRVSGGGAVYHDMGNLNFSFICSNDRYCEKEQTAIILKAIEKLGIRAETTGRNDIAIEGRKVSGNAYCQRGNNRMRHGTLLVSSDLTVFDRYLNVPEKKLNAKGVKSVKSRVCNICEYAGAVTVEKMVEMILESFQETYGTFEPFVFTEEAEREIERLFKRNESWEWKMGEAPMFDYSFENKFAWGMTQAHITVKNGCISRVNVYTDSLNTEFSSMAETILKGAKFSKEEMLEMYKKQEGEIAQLIEYIIANME